MRFECRVCKKLVSIKEGELGIEVICPHCSHPVKVPDNRLANGFVVADFIIRDEIGHGGMGKVYAAHQISLDRPAAVKVLNDKYAKDFEFVASFVKEARAAAKLNHPNIVQAYAVGVDEGIFYFAMEFIDGETLKQVLRREKSIPVDKAVDIVISIAEAMDYGWKEQQMVHCDIKPDNIMLTSKGVAKLADLGLAKKAEESQDDDDEVLGTPQYISPEQLTGSKLDIRTDIFSLGASFYQFVTGRLPFEGNTLNEIAQKRLTHDPIPPNKLNPAIPQPVNDIILKMLKRNPNDRFRDCEELLAALREFKDGHSSRGSAAATQRRKGKKFTVRRREIPAENQTMTSPTVPVAGTMTLDKPDSDKPDLKIVLLIPAVFILIVLISVIYWLSSSNEKEKQPTTGPKKISVTKTTKPASPVVKTAKNREQLADLILKFNFKIKALLLDYKNKKIDKDEFISRVDRLMVEYPEIPDKKNFAKLMAVYIPLDEERIKQLREKEHRNYLAVAERRRKIAEKKRREAERLAEQRRKLQEQLEKERKLAAELERKEREAKAKALRELNKYRATLRKKQDELRFQFVDLCVKHQFKKLYNLLEVAKKSELNRVQYDSDDKIAAAKKFAEWVTNMQDSLKKCEKIYNLFNNSGTLLAGKQIEKNYKLYTIQSINNGIATITKPSTEDEGLETVHIRLESLGRAFGKFFAREVKRLNIKGAAFYYYLSKGYFQYKMVPPNDFWVEELSKLKYQYFKKKYATASPAEKRRMKRIYGKLYSFKRAIN